MGYFPFRDQVFKHCVSDGKSSTGLKSESEQSPTDDTYLINFNSKTRLTVQTSGDATFVLLHILICHMVRFHFYGLPKNRAQFKSLIKD